MKANELRIGNLIYDFFGNPMTVISKTLIDLELNRKFHPPKPIPLTPEILEKCGFKKGLKHISEHSWIRFDIDGIYLTISDNAFEAYNYAPPCKYLHQLQNLYFALTGEELNITL